MIAGICLLCFTKDIKVFDIYNSQLQYVYERISDFAVNNTYNMCYICCTRLQQFYSLIEQTKTSTDSRNHQVVTGTELTLVNIENASIPYHTGIKQENEIQVKVENISDNEVEVDVALKDRPNKLNGLHIIDSIVKEEKQQKGSKTKEKKEFSCNVCSKIYTRKSSMHNHRKKHTQGSCVCPICGAQFTWKANLKTHMITHTKEKPFPCDICNKRFKRSDHLKLHKVTHSKEKPFFCDTCGMEFRRKSTLQAHKQIHTGDRVYTCDYCKKKFNRKGNLKIHILGHTNQKPYKCGACERSYVTKRILKLHVQKHCPYLKAKAQ